jgi:hypothetical protein
VISHGQVEGTVRKDVKPKKLAQFLVAAIEGSFGLAKAARSPTLLRSNLEVLSTLLESFRPVRKSTRSRRPIRSK